MSSLVVDLLLFLTVHPVKRNRKCLMMFPSLRIGLCQMRVGADKALNIVNAGAALMRAKELGSNLVVLPECWNCPYSTAAFPEYAEVVPAKGEYPDSNMSPSTSMLCKQAKELGIWLVGGSVPEAEGDETTGRKIYNTSVVINPEGNIIGKHRKVHLFDIDVPGQMTFKESDSLSPGNDVTVVDTPWGGLGVGICYDVRFPELAGIMRQRGANIIVYPGAFNMVTGPAHWELLQRARAVDNNVFVAMCSPARVEGASYVAWGHSSVVSPWGTVLLDAGPEEDTVVVDVDFTALTNMRQNIPCWQQKRGDLYHLQDISS